MSGQLKRSSPLPAKRIRPFVSRRMLGEVEVYRADLSPTGLPAPSPSAVSAKPISSPYGTAKHEGSRRLRAKAKPTAIDVKAEFEVLNRSSSFLQSTPQRAKSNAKMKAEGRWSVTPKGERNSSNSRLLVSSKLESLAFDSEEEGVELAGALLEEVALAHPRLIDTLKVIKSRYERRIEHLADELMACKHTITLQKKEIEGSHLHEAQLQDLLESQQAKAHAYPSAVEGRYKKQNEFLLQVLNNLNSRGYPVQAAYAEVQKSVSTADSGDSPTESKPWDRPRIVPRLKLSHEQHPDFQAEFFAKLEEFSESWKVQIPKGHQEV